MACLFGHKWNGNKCEKCGKPRDEGHDKKPEPIQNPQVLNPRHCHVCGRDDLKFEREQKNSTTDAVAICCVRCKASICVGCRSKLTQHSPDSRDGQLCPFCGQYTIYEYTGKSDYSQLLQQTEMRYGRTK